MPYLKPENRKPMDEIVQLMMDMNVSFNGDINYILFKLAKRTVKPSYANYKNVCGELECCKLEIYRELVAPYEEIKKKENGIVE
jgi:hypothetical protein